MFKNEHSEFVGRRARGSRSSECRPLLRITLFWLFSLKHFLQKEDMIIYLEENKLVESIEMNRPSFTEIDSSSDGWTLKRKLIEIFP